MDTGKYEPVRITNIIVEQVSEPLVGALHYKIPLRLSRIPEPEWVRQFLRAWDEQKDLTSMHLPAMEIGSDRIILDGTTIDDLEQSHIGALKLAVDEANRISTEKYEELQDPGGVRKKEQTRHHEYVAEVAKRIRFD